MGLKSGIRDVCVQRIARGRPVWIFLPVAVPIDDDGGDDNDALHDFLVVDVDAQEVETRGHPRITVPMTDRHRR
jgi:hypothetical protein